VNPPPSAATVVPSAAASASVFGAAKISSSRGGSVQKQPLPKSVTFATSGLGGMLGWVLVHPANTLAVRMNLASMSGQPFSFGKMVKENGYLSLYDGA
jgi:solute carrier family 25 oxoglutarate transporter 11